MILACQKLLGQITKLLGFGKTLPPRMGKTPKKSRIFFLTGSHRTIAIKIALRKERNDRSFFCCFIVDCLFGYRCKDWFMDWLLINWLVDWNFKSAFLREDVDEMFEKHDKDRDGMLSWAEFSGEETKNEKAFKLMDADHNGKITKGVSLIILIHGRSQKMWV